MKFSGWDYLGKGKLKRRGGQRDMRREKRVGMSRGQEGEGVDRPHPLF